MFKAGFAQFVILQTVTVGVTASFLYSGNYNSSQLYNVGSNGNWWSSTVNNTNNGYNLNLNSNGNVNPQNNNNKYNGFAVRCVAQ